MPRGTTYRRAAKAVEKERQRTYGSRLPSLPSSAQRTIPNRPAYQIGSPASHGYYNNGRHPATPIAYDGKRKKLTPAVARLRDQYSAPSPKASSQPLWAAPTSAHALPLHRRTNLRMSAQPTPINPLLTSPLAGRSTRRTNTERLPMFPELGLLDDDNEGPLAISTPSRPLRKHRTQAAMPSPFLVDSNAVEYTPFSLSLANKQVDTSISLPGVPGDFPTPVARKRPASDEEQLPPPPPQQLPSINDRKRAKHRVALLQQKRPHTAVDVIDSEKTNAEPKRPRSNSEVEREMLFNVDTATSIEEENEEKENEELADTTPVLPKRPVMPSRLKEVAHDTDMKNKLDGLNETDTASNTFVQAKESVIMIGDTTEEETEELNDAIEDDIEEEEEGPVTVDLPLNVAISSESEVDDERKDATYTEEQAEAEMSESDFDIDPMKRRNSGKSRYLSLPKIDFSSAPQQEETEVTAVPTTTTTDAIDNDITPKQKKQNTKARRRRSSKLN
ncbi:hypothetical protein BDF19DRAFT_274351 [Syncephalis fuscata]|nr:hypothetical protein BDF19DRAFT_274351 [Syncephalis fuscata]